MKLTKAKIQRIKNLFKSGYYNERDLSVMFDVNVKTIKELTILDHATSVERSTMEIMVKMIKDNPGIEVKFMVTCDDFNFDEYSTCSGEPQFCELVNYTVYGDYIVNDDEDLEEKLIWDNDLSVDDEEALKIELELLKSKLKFDKAIIVTIGN